jgi:hypothetical protein
MREEIGRKTSVHCIIRISYDDEEMINIGQYLSLMLFDTIYPYLHKYTPEVTPKII